MTSLISTTLPPLPLLLWETPPGLEQILAQEGAAFEKVRDPHPLAFRGGRFVLFDGRRVSQARIRSTLTPDHVALDIDVFRRNEPMDPFVALIDTRAERATWYVDSWPLTERVARYHKAAIRHRLIHRLRRAITRAGGLWARIAAFPFPYRSAFNFRADLDEPYPKDYVQFARARRTLADCCTHFVSTHAYGTNPAVLLDLLRFDTQSHGHYHVVYRDPEANRCNLERAHHVLSQAGFEPVGFAAPHGCWNAGLDYVLEQLGYLYSSDFQLGYDDRPFFPWRGDRFSRVLQIPIHPLCEGLFFEAGVLNARVVIDHLVNTVQANLEAGEPAFVYGHPERRLGRCPEILAELGTAVAGESFLWRVTLTEFAHWWSWRHGRRWSVLPRGEGRYEVQFDDWSNAYRLGLEFFRGHHVATVPISGPRMVLQLEDLAYERREVLRQPPLPLPSLSPRTLSLKAALHHTLDWETATPLEDLPENTLSDRVKKCLRSWRHKQRARVG